MKTSKKTKNIGLANLLKNIRTGEHILIGGRPSMGKTSLALSLILDLSIINRHTCIFFSPITAHSKDQLINRILSMETGISIRLIRNRLYSNKQFFKLHSTQKDLYTAPIFIDDSKLFSLKIVDQRLRYLRKKSKGKIYVFFGDFLQTFTENEKYSTVLKSLNFLAKKYGAIFISSVHLNRQSSESTDHRPRLEEMKSLPDLSTIERIILVYRSDYYDKSAKDNSMEITVYKGDFSECLNYMARISQDNLRVSGLRIHKKASARR